MSGAFAVAVLGGGAWGTALAMQAQRAGHAVRLWASDGAAVEALNRGENPRYLPGVRLDAGIAATTDMAAALEAADCVLAVTPAQVSRTTLEAMPGLIAPGIPLVLCAKGIEHDSGLLLSEIAETLLPANPVAALSGPSFAADVAQGPADGGGDRGPRRGARRRAGAAIFDRTVPLLFDRRPRRRRDRRRAEERVCACRRRGDGAGLGASAQAAMVTRGFVELRRMGQAFGADPETLMGLSGPRRSAADLLLGAIAQFRLWRWQSDEARASPDLPLAEGVATAAIAARIARERGIDAPIIAAVAAILAGEMNISEAVSALMSRPLRSETD